MDLTTITVADFKAQFPRDFAYFTSIAYDPTKVYNTGDEVWYATNNLFYQALVDGVTAVTPGTDPNKWVKFADTINNWVQDSDITRAFSEALIACNQALFDSDANNKIGFLYLTAHYLVIDLRAALGGLNAAGGGFPVSSRTVGSVSESYTIPASILESPLYALYAQTAYGTKYLALIISKITGNITSVWGGSLP
jgi:hypothetical protein